MIFFVCSRLVIEREQLARAGHKRDNNTGNSLYTPPETEASNVPSKAAREPSFSYCLSLNWPARNVMQCVAGHSVYLFALEMEICFHSPLGNALYCVSIW